MSTKRHRSHQLHLFRPRPRTPQWHQLSPETRQKVLPLLAKLLRTTKEPANRQEVSHER